MPTDRPCPLPQDQRNLHSSHIPPPLFHPPVNAYVPLLPPRRFPCATPLATPRYPPQHVTPPPIGRHPPACQWLARGPPIPTGNYPSDSMLLCSTASTALEPHTRSLARSPCTHYTCEMTESSQTRARPVVSMYVHFSHRRDTRPETSMASERFRLEICTSLDTCMYVWIWRRAG